MALLMTIYPVGKSKRGKTGSWPECIYQVRTMEIGRKTMKLKRGLFGSGLLVALSTQTAAAEDMLQWCLNAYPHKVDWCNSQYPAKPAAPAATEAFVPPPQAKAAEPAPAVAHRGDDLDNIDDARIMVSNRLADPFMSYSIAIGQKVSTTNGMGCYRHSEDDYRCVKRVLERGAIIMAPQISGVSRDYIDRNCFTFIRGFKDIKCAFNVTFRLASRGLDHMEQVQIYQSDRINLRPWSKY
ncbi:MAG: hypothetical protein WAP03_30620 [Methylorubrum rhodinum]|uniref:hypothetical protein n=1 Tax=Methylorubrum rhodinum TaxID=29428 RepID=UPI003BAFE0F5